MEATTQPIKIRRTTKAALDVLKVHPRETYDDVLRRLIERETSEPVAGDGHRAG